MSKINKVVVKGVSYDIEDAQAREDIESMVTEVTWGQSNHIDDYIKAGVYDITGTRESTSDGLPITNMGENATIAAKLFVTVTPEGATTYRHSVGQTLILSNAEGKETKMYTRNGNRTSADGGVTYTVTWGAWATLQTNINVETVDNLDNLKDNGIYSGVWTKGSYNAYPLTFVCIVINDYIVGIEPRRISQFVYGLSKLNGTVVYQTRVWDDSKNAWGGWEILNQKEISSMISNEIKKVTDGVDPEKLDSLKDLIAWVDTHGGEVAGIKSDIQANEVAIETETERAKDAEQKLEEKIAKEKTALVNGDTIVGQAREVYSRTGKVDSATFLKRTTAGGTSISDGVASVKQIGGNIVKNNIDNTTLKGVNSVIERLNDNIIKITPIADERFGVYAPINHLSNHKYYLSAIVYTEKADNVYAFPTGQVAIGAAVSGYCYVSGIDDTKGSQMFIYIGRDNKVPESSYGYIKDIFHIDLTEMFGAGNEPTKEECDRMFGTMDAIPQGLTVAQPTGLKSIGYNQWNPANVLLNKGIVENAIEDDVADRHIAIVECLPCKIGAGENNGYIIGYGEGDNWSEGDIEVYFSPINPMDYIGQEDVNFYMHKLEMSADYGTYVPQCKGYLLVVTPTIDKLCVHFHWSGDREVTDYEEYVESNVVLPTIPEMSEWGLAGIQSSGTLTCDEIDFERGVYIKRIGAVDMGTLTWSYTYNKTLFKTYLYGAKQPIFGNIANIITNRYNTKRAWDVASEVLLDKQIMLYISSYELYVADNAYNSISDFKDSLKGVMLYYELEEPEEYPLPKIGNNYISSDYGIEQFDSVVPCNANNLYYMRSLVGETRNFIDQLYTNTQKTDAKEVADYITNTIAENSNKVNNAVSAALRTLYIAAGAEYNDSDETVIKKLTIPAYNTNTTETIEIEHLPEHYYLNGLGDITEDEMAAIYNTTKNVCYIQAYSGLWQFRTLLFNGSGSATAVSGLGLFYGCSSLRSIIFKKNLFFDGNTGSVFYAVTLKIKYFLPATPNAYWYCYKGIKDSFFYTTGPDATCPIEEIRPYKLRENASFSKCPNLSVNSIRYAINTSDCTKNISITLHPDAYARLTANSDLMSDLETKNNELAATGGHIDLLSA